MLEVHSERKSWNNILCKNHESIMVRYDHLGASVDWMTVRLASLCQVQRRLCHAAIRYVGNTY